MPSRGTSQSSAAKPFSILHCPANLPFCSMVDQSKYYITGAFILGATLAVLYQNVPSSTHKHGSSEQQLKQQRNLISRLSKIDDLATLKKSLAEIETTFEKGGGNIREGIEGCIGGTPLIKIKSLSDATGCEILVKAEVRYHV
jgi:cysteine synthase A